VTEDGSELVGKSLDAMIQHYLVW